ncbi:MAG: hypothetical protein Ct9H300mP15_09010 [Gemmatimonadota bacterium]|nr:MAG: hypothetical protein Ct9H300mP15_09010 [Gemmatimonadota bacterium]
MMEVEREPPGKNEDSGELEENPNALIDEVWGTSLWTRKNQMTEALQILGLARRAGAGAPGKCRYSSVDKSR